MFAYLCLFNRLHEHSGPAQEITQHYISQESVSHNNSITPIELDILCFILWVALNQLLNLLCIVWFLLFCMQDIYSLLHIILI